MASAGRYDVIVVGGGHNGLVASAYLARNGARALVLEARPKTGGAADTMSPWPEAPGFKVTTLSYVMSLMPDTILRDLRLERHGYRGIPVGPYFVPFPDGRSILQSDDDVDRRHRRSVLRVGTGEDGDGAERPDRDLGRSARAGDGVRDGASFDRGCRRGTSRLLGDADRRDGRRRGGARVQREEPRC